MAVELKEVRSRFEQLKQERQSWEPLWKDIRDYEAPDLGAFEGEDPQKGYKRYTRIRDAEAIECADYLAAGLFSGVSSPSRPWLRLTTTDPELDESFEVKQWLDDVRRLMMMAFAKSDCYAHLHKSYLELPLFGTACTLIRPHPDDVLNLQNLTIGEYWIGDDPFGRVDTLYRRFKMTAKQIVKQWGLENVSQAVKNAYEKTPFQAFDIVHAVEPRFERDERKRDNMNAPWRSVYFEDAAPDAGGKVLSESGFRDFPAMVPRWMTTAGAVYGRGPGAKALNAAKALQFLAENENTAVAYASNPPIQYPASFVGRLDQFRPGGRIPVQGTDAQALRSAFDVALDVQGLELLIARRKAEVQRAFYTNIFQMIQGGAGTDRTATEVQALEQEKYIFLGPVLERLHSEMLDPMVSNAFTFLLEAGRIPEPPQELRGKPLSVEYISVLAEAQKASNVGGVMRMVQQIGVLAQMNPNALDKVDVDATIDELADMNGVPPSMIVASDKVALIRDQRAQAQQQTDQMQQMQMGASALKDLGAAADSSLKTAAGDLVAG